MAVPENEPGFVTLHTILASWPGSVTAFSDASSMNGSDTRMVNGMLDTQAAGMSFSTARAVTTNGHSPTGASAVALIG